MSVNTARNEWERFETLGADPADVFRVLSMTVSGPASYNGKRARLGEPPAIDVGYTGSGRPFVRRVEGAPVPDWATLFTAVQAGLAGRAVWTTFAMSGLFRTSGGLATPSLQLRPVDDLRIGVQGFPFNQDFDSAAVIPLNAVLVDVIYDGATDIFINAQRRNRAVAEAANLMSLVGWPKLWRPDGQMLDWTPAYGLSPGEVVNIKTVHGFYHPRLGDQPERPAVDEAHPMAKVEHERSAAGPLDLLGGDLYMPDSLPELHETLISLPPPERTRADRALAFYADGMRTANPSTKIASWVASVEALLPSAKGAICPECLQPRFEISRKVKALLDTYAGKALRKEYRDAVYDLRSRLAHGIWHYAVDSPPFSLLDDRYTDEFKVAAAARATLMNWLLDRSRRDVSAGTT